jgi:hypothetical protein
MQQKVYSKLVNNYRSSKSAFLPLPSHHAQHHMEVPQKSINI